MFFLLLLLFGFFGGGCLTGFLVLFWGGFFLFLVWVFFFSFPLSDGKLYSWCEAVEVACCQSVCSWALTSELAIKSKQVKKSMRKNHFPFQLMRLHVEEERG